MKPNFTIQIYEDFESIPIKNVLSVIIPLYLYLQDVIAGEKINSPAHAYGNQKCAWVSIFFYFSTPAGKIVKKIYSKQKLWSEF